MNAAEFIVQMLEEEGVKYLFGVPGSGIEDLNNAIHKSSITRIVTKHGAGAAYIADGYARVSGKMGVCCTTAGPGATNLITGLATSYADYVPVCAITGQIDTAMFGKRAIQESGSDGMNMEVIFRHFTKYSGMLCNEQRTQYMVQKAFRMAHTSPGGPVHLNLPADIMKRTTTKEISSHPHWQHRSYDPEATRTAAELLMRARNPAIVAGWGVALSRGARELKELALLLDIPVAASPKAKGIFPESHPLSLGGIGFAGSSIAADFIEEGKVDVLLAVGTSLNEMTCCGWDENSLPVEHLIHIDVDSSKIGNKFSPSVGVIGDARIALNALCEHIRETMSSDARARRVQSSTARQGIRFLRNREQLLDERPINNNRAYHPRTLVEDLQRYLPDNTLYFVDIGNVMAWAIRYLKIEKPYSFFVSLGFGGVGHASAAPVGGQLALPGRTVVALVGDGGFLMNGMEVATAVEYNLPVIWVVFNHARFDQIYHGRKLSVNPAPNGTPSRFKRVDFARMAQGLGARGIRIETPDQFTGELVQDILASQQPTVLDVRIDEEAVPPFIGRIRNIDKQFAA
jgi:acetolactate synthase I/II/III large subunit